MKEFKRLGLKNKEILLDKKFFEQIKYIEKVKNENEAFFATLLDDIQTELSNYNISVSKTKGN